jgi:hypothetical protein
MRIAIFTLLFALVLTFTTLANQHGELAFGWHRFTSYGWPEAWLRVHITDKTTWANGKREPGERTVERRIDWQPFLLAAGTAAGIAGVLSLPVFLWPAKRQEDVA